MKKITLLFLLTTQTLLAQKGGINFRQVPIAEVFQAARRANKPVFVEIYSPQCHICQGFMPTLADKRVGKVYNDKFISTKLDIGLPETRAFMERRKLYVPSLPLFLFFDPQENLIHFAMSNNTTDEIIRHGNNAVNPAQRSQTMAQRFTQGDRNENFLVDYAMYAKITRDTVANIKAAEEYAKQQPASSYNNPTNWLVLQKIVLDMDNPLAQYLFDYPSAYKAYSMESVKAVAENILMSSLFSSRGAKYSPAKILEVRQGLAKIGISPSVAANRTLLPEVNAYFRTKQTAKAIARMDSQVANNDFVVPEYLYVSRLFNRSSPDATDAPTVAKWLMKALALKPAPKEQADLYYELAEAHRRAGKVADAQKAAQKAMELAQSAKLDTRRNVEQMGKLK